MAMQISLSLIYVFIYLLDSITMKFTPISTKNIKAYLYSYAIQRLSKLLLVLERHRISAEVFFQQLYLMNSDY